MASHSQKSILNLSLAEVRESAIASAHDLRISLDYDAEDNFKPTGTYREKMLSIQKAPLFTKETKLNFCPRDPNERKYFVTAHADRQNYFEFRCIKSNTIFKMEIQDFFNFFEDTKTFLSEFDGIDFSPRFMGLHNAFRRFNVKCIGHMKSLVAEGKLDVVIEDLLRCLDLAMDLSDPHNFFEVTPPDHLQKGLYVKFISIAASSEAATMQGTTNKERNISRTEYEELHKIFLERKKCFYDLDSSEIVTYDPDHSTIVKDDAFAITQTDDELVLSLYIIDAWVQIKYYLGADFTPSLLQNLYVGRFPQRYLPFELLRCMSLEKGTTQPMLRFRITFNRKDLGKKPHIQVTPVLGKISGNYHLGNKADYFTKSKTLMIHRAIQLFGSFYPTSNILKDSENNLDLSLVNMSKIIHHIITRNIIPKMEFCIIKEAKSLPNPYQRPYKIQSKFAIYEDRKIIFDPTIKFKSPLRKFQDLMFQMAYWGEFECLERFASVKVLNSLQGEREQFIREFMNKFKLKDLMGKKPKASTETSRKRQASSPIPRSPTTKKIDF
ncbi:hypothetical protein [Carp edema virus]|nr:hypothetical protein [Carp edema virus]